MSSDRIRYYGELDPAKVKGEMPGRRMVREWDPATGLKRTCYETIMEVSELFAQKQINGQDIISPHYPPIGGEIR